MNNVTAINTVPSVPSISSAAMLSELTISVWTARKKDQQASDQVTMANAASNGMASVNKRLVRCNELDAVQKFASNSRNAHYGMTMPWSDTGLRLLPTAQYFRYHQAMTALQNQFDRLVQEFLAAYTWEVSQAEAQLGNMFHADEYPSVDKLASKFRFQLTYIPLPDAGDFRVDVGNEAQAELQEHYSNYYSQQLELAMSDVWQRLSTALGKMSERLDYGEDDKKKVFRDTLVENALDMVDLLHTCNVANDPAMELMQRTLSSAFRGVTPDGLREDAGLRKEVKECVDDALSNLPSLDW